MWASVRQWLGRVGAKQKASPATPPSAEQFAAIEGNTALVRKLFTDLTGTDYPPGLSGVEYLDGFMERTSPSLEGEARDRMATMAGCYVGSSLIAQFGGTWIQDEAGLGVRLPDGSIAYPINKAMKQLNGGVGDSVRVFFETMAAFQRASRK